VTKATKRTKASVRKNRKPPTAERHDSSGRLAMSDSSEKSDIPEPIPDAWLRQITQLIQTEMKRIMKERTLPKLQTSDLDLPPQPPGKVPGPAGKPRKPGKRVKVGSTLDAALYEALEDWRRTKGLTLAAALDALIWKSLGQPRMSYESGSAT